jgi:hypothetical protein
MLTYYNEVFNSYKNPMQKKIVIVIIAAVGGVVLLGGSSYVIYKEATDPDWSIVESIINFGKEVKDEPKGCCPPHDGLLTKTECDQSGGFEWREEECPGFAVKLIGESDSDLSGGGEGYTKYIFDMYNCEDSIYSNWKGHWSFYWIWTTSDGEKVPWETVHHELDVNISPEGKGSFDIYWEGIHVRTVLFSTDGFDMSFEVEQKNLDPASDTKEIIRGAGRCVKQTKS